MTRRILINGRRAEEVRVAIVENQTLDDYEIETLRSGLLRNNIYRGVVANIAPSLNAAFVDFGDVKNGFLAFNDVVESAYCRPVKDAYRISDVLVPGQEIIVQVIKDAGGPKGAQVTTNISLAGRYLVLRPKDAKSGVSRKVDDDARADLTQKVRSLDLPEGYGCIVRTNAMDQSRAILLRDAKALVQLWHKIEAEAARGNGPQLLYNDQDIVVSVMRDYFDSSINEVLIDDKSCYERAMTYVKATIASGKEKIKLYEDKMPIFSRYGIEKQIEQIYARQVSLPSGGYIVIDPTEALTAIDVNSAHATKRENQDLTAYHTNLEAATEIGRQLRMRDIGGLIVVDFIDMRSGKHQRDVERVMRNAMARDKARNKVERISANGLLEINRQRISQALSQRMHLTCPTCGGRGTIPSAEAIGMNLMREIDARAASGNLGGVNIKLHPDIAQQLQNERRREFAQLETEYDIRIEIIATREMSRGEEAIEWLTKKQTDALYPDKITQHDAASIIDVAEVYQNQDEIDDAYRPNDFEEFSSDDARRKRASRRAQRREASCAECEENSTQLAAATCRPTAKNDADESTPRKRSRREESRNDEVSRTTAPARTDLRSDARAVDSHRLPGIGIASGLLALSVLVEKIAPHMDDPKLDERSKRRFSARRRAFKKDASSVGTDYRMFTLDLAKAICVRAFGLSTEIARRDMLARLVDVARYFEAVAMKPEDERLAIVSDLRVAITSRHASARLSCLFDANPDAQADEMATMLVQARDNAITAMTRHTTVDCRTAAEKTITEALARVFGAEKTDPVDESTENDESYTIADAVAESKEDVARYPEVDIASIPDATRRSSRQRQRVNRRAAIGAQTPDARNEDDNAKTSIDDANLVTADVAISPMTIVDDATPADKNDETAASDASQDDSLETTLEMPRVSRERRRDRRSRDRRNAADRNVDSVNAISKVETSENAPLTSSETQNEAARLETPNNGDEATTNETSTSNDAPTTSNDTPTTRRRERRTRRPQIGSELADPIVQTENEKTTTSTIEKTDETVTQTIQAVAADAPSVPSTDSENAATTNGAKSEEKNRSRRSRNRKGRTPADEEIVGNAAQNEATTEQRVDETTTDTTQSKKTTDGKKTPKSQKTSKTDKSQGKAVPNSVEIDENHRDDEVRTTRRVRKVNAAPIDTALYAKDSASPSTDIVKTNTSDEESKIDVNTRSEADEPVERERRRSRNRSKDKAQTSCSAGDEQTDGGVNADDAKTIETGVATKTTRRTRTVRTRISTPTADDAIAASDSEQKHSSASNVNPSDDAVAPTDDANAPSETTTKPRRVRQTRRARPGFDGND